MDIGFYMRLIHAFDYAALIGLAFLFPPPQCGAIASEREKIFITATPNAK
jgi:hypothetical protein